MGDKTNKKFPIIRDRVEFYKDFTINLLHHIYNYYLDKEVLSLDEDIKNHFMFCYKKTCDEFLEEGIDFSDNKKLIEYFYTYYYHHFYKTEKNVPIEHFLKFWRGVFDVDKQMNKSVLKMMVEIYAIYDESINSEKNILELV